MMNSIQRWLPAIVLLLSINANAQQLPDANKYLHVTALHTRERSWPFPANCADDPPSLLWPGTAGKTVTYQVRYSQDSSFPAGKTTTSEVLPWAMYALHTPLQKGKWYWQYASRAHDKAAWSWSAVRYFNVVTPTATPSIPAMLAKIPRQHPRLWGMQEKAAAFRAANKQNPEAIALLANCDKLIGAPLPEEKPTRPRDTTGMNAQQQEKMIEFMFHGFGEKVAQPIRNLCTAWWLSEDPKYATEAVRRAMQLTGLEPDSYGTRDDFNNGNALCY